MEQNIAFDKNWFEKYQATLLWLSNTPIIKLWFRYVLRINGKRSSVGNKKIIKIEPNSITWGQENYFSTEFRIHNKFSKRLLYAFYPFWYVLHLWDTLFANKFVPNYNFGFDTLTEYPDAGTSGTSVDAFLFRYGGTSGDTWSNMRNASACENVYNTNIWNPDSTGLVAHLQTAGFGNNNKWAYMSRSIHTVDTSTIDTTATIIDATFSIYGDSTYTYNDEGQSASLALCGSTPASNNIIVLEDWDQVGRTSFATAIAWSSYSNSGYNNFSLNASGLSNITKEGITRFSFQTEWDRGNSEPTWTQGLRVGFGAYYADRSGTTYDPKLVVNYYGVSLSPSVSITTSVSISPSASPSLSSSISVSLSPSLSTTKSPSVSPTPSPSISVSISPSLSPSASISVSLSRSISASPSPSPEHPRLVSIESASRIFSSEVPMEAVHIGREGDPLKLYIYNGRIFLYDTIGQSLIDGGFISANAIESGTITTDKISFSNKKYVHNLVWTADDANTASWSSGAIYFPDGTSTLIDAGNTGNLTDTNFIYFDGTSVLKKTADETTAVSASYIPLVIVTPTSDSGGKCLITSFNLPGATIDGDKIVMGRIQSTDGKTYFDLDDEKRIVMSDHEDPRLVIGNVSGSYTMRTSLHRCNALTDTEQTHYSIYADSDNVLVKEFARGEVNVGPGATATIVHNLGYIPSVWVYHQRYVKYITGWDEIVYVSNANLYIHNDTLSESNDFSYYIFYDLVDS